MLKIFRNVRMKNLAESNFPRYLKYAIGEILLVVIGILLALQINTWNNQRLERKSEKEYISRLASELASEIEYYKTVKDQFIIKEETLKRIIVTWQSGSNIIKDSLQYINDFNTAGAIGPWYYEPITWNQLRSTGDLKLIKDHNLIDALFAYYGRVESFAENYLLHPMNMTNRAREIFHHPFIEVNPDDYFKERKFMEVPDDSVYENIWINRKEYTKLFSSIAYISKVQHKAFEGIIEKGGVILESLESKK